MLLVQKILEFSKLQKAIESIKMQKAINFIKLKHKGQIRKFSGEPYHTHPIAVSNIVLEHKDPFHPNDLLVASLLHDTLEDTDTTFEELSDKFSPAIASLVLELTNDKQAIKELGKLEYQKRRILNISSHGLVIKLADRLHNLTDNPTKKTISDTLELVNYLIKNRELTESQKTMAFYIRSLCILDRHKKY